MHSQAAQQTLKTVAESLSPYSPLPTLTEKRALSPGFSHGDKAAAT